MGLFSAKTLDEKISRSVVFFFLLQNANASFKTVFEFSDELSRLISVGTGGLIILFFAWSFGNVWKRKASMFIKTVLLFIVIYGISIAQTKYIRGEDISLLLSDSALWTFAFWIPIGVYTSAIEDYSVLYRTFKKYSMWITFFLFVSFAWYYLVGSKQEAKDYNMFFSYALILPLLIHINEYIDSKTTFYGIVALLEIVAILLYGSRGAFLCLGGYFLLKMFMGSLNKGEKKQYIFIVIIIALSLLYLISNSSALESLGFNSRIISKMAEGEATSGREYVWQAGIYLISERPLFGYGLGGEFYQMSWLCEKITGVLIEEYSSLTPHNGFLQLMLNFGIPVGLIFGLYILFSVRSIKLVPDKKVKDLIIVLFAAFVLPALTVSDGIFIKPGIAVYLFLVITLKKQYNEYRKS